jgi:hypothetical protein
MEQVTEQTTQTATPEAQTTQIGISPSVKLESIGGSVSNGVFSFAPQTNTEPKQAPATEPVIATQTEQPATTQVSATETKPTAPVQQEVKLFADDSLNATVKQAQADTPYYKRVGEKLGKQFNDELEFEQHVLNLQSQNVNLQQSTVQDETLLALQHVINSAPEGQKNQAVQEYFNLINADWNAKGRDGQNIYSDDQVIKAYYRQQGHLVDNEDFDAELEGMTSFQKMGMATPFRRELQQGINQTVANIKQQALANAPKYNAEVVKKTQDWGNFVEGYEQHAKTAPNALNEIPMQGFDIIRKEYIAKKLKDGSIIDNLFRDAKTKELSYDKLELAILMFDPNINADYKKGYIDRDYQKIYPQAQTQIEREITKKAMNFPEQKPDATRVATRAGSVDINDLPQQTRQYITTK